MSFRCKYKQCSVLRISSHTKQSNTISFLWTQYWLLIVFVFHLLPVVFEQLSNSIQLRVALLKNAGQKIKILRIADTEEFLKN